MLINFTVGNFKAFKDKVTLDMRAASFSKAEDSHVIDAGKVRLLKNAAIFGPNASGKSKLLQAIQFMRDFVINSSKNTQVNEEIEVDPFRLNTETKHLPSFFEAEFLIEDTSYRYGFEVSQASVEAEWLFFKPNNLTEKPLFVRKGSEIEIVPSKFKEGKGIEAKTRGNALFLSAVAQWNGAVSMRIVEWFDKLHFFDGTSWESEDDSETSGLLSDERYRLLISELLRIADLGILEVEYFDFDEVLEKNSGKKLPLTETHEHLSTKHRIYDGMNNELGTISFEMEADESAGTLKFFCLLGLVLKTMEKGEILFSDEINARLHTRLMQAIMLLFNSKIANKNGAQFISTIHDTNLIDIDFLSRDQIWFLEKDRYGASRLYSLAEFKTRKDVNHEREYFMGRYGAIPFIENLEKAFEKIENGRKNTAIQAA